MQKFIAKYGTNILATLYVVVVQIVAGVFHIAKCWTNADWPVKCLMALDAPSKFLSQFEKK